LAPYLPQLRDGIRDFFILDRKCGTGSASSPAPEAKKFLGAAAREGLFQKALLA
jgi:hypothetical protein